MALLHLLVPNTQTHGRFVCDLLCWPMAAMFSISFYCADSVRYIHLSDFAFFSFRTVLTTRKFDMCALYVLLPACLIMMMIRTRTRFAQFTAEKTSSHELCDVICNLFSLSDASFDLQWLYRAYSMDAEWNVWFHWCDNCSLHSWASSPLHLRSLSSCRILFLLKGCRCYRMPKIQF